ncbi:outer membrane lipoprotein carrier protein LolA [Halorientalis brevis]|uniref:Outer membrane lipoprotein carrier protein LolA n=1 Tax=Halorientalis brevis TaxID=1126241 RepID=A0ABD6CEP9_9EURY|nr:outer membrane lipoprotein carrier protein LolA [Halorientalis brevis]
MHPDTVSPSAVLKAVVVVGVLAGAAIAFVPLGAETAPNQSRFGDHAATQVATIDGIDATVVTVIERENGTSRSVERVQLRPATGEFRAVLVSSTEHRWDRRVSNGSHLWLYDRDENEVDRIDLSPRADANGTSVRRLQRLLERLDRTRAPATPATTPTPGIQPLPAVPSAGTSGASVARGGALDATYVSNETVAGRATYLVQLQSNSSSDAAMVTNYTQRLWLDAEYFYPLKRQTSWRRGGDRTQITTTYRNVTFNPGLDDEAFRFDPPADATVDASGGHYQETYGSLSALQRAASTSVPVPDVPKGFELAYTSRTTIPGRVKSVGLRYVNATASLAISKSNLTWYEPETTNDSVSIDGRTGEFRNLGPKQVVSWSCDGWRYSVTGRGLRKPLLIDVAESVTCE